MKKSLLLFFPVVIATMLVLAGTSCKKNTDCKATVKCVEDSTSAAVAGALVELYAEVKSPDGKTTYTADLKATGTTAGDGSVQFTFQLPAIYDIKATKVVGTNTIVGKGIIKLEEGKTVEKTVVMKKPA
jgi:hypothetical protein